MAARNYLAFSQYEDMSTASFGLYRPDGELIEIIYEHVGDFKMHETGMFFVGEERFGVIILPAGSESEQSIRVSGVLSNPSGLQISDWIANHGAILGLEEVELVSVCACDVAKSATGLLTMNVRER